MNDNITLPRKHIDYAAHALEHFNNDAPDPLVSEIITALRTALAAEPTKQEPVEWMVYTLDGRLCRETAAILREALAAETPKPVRLYATTTGVLLGSAWLVWNTPKGANDEIMSQETADLLNRMFAENEALRRDAEQPKPEPVAMFDEQMGHPVLLLGSPMLKDKQPLYTAPPATHPGYIIGSHWLETAYSRICAGEAEADVLRDCGWERVDDALRRDAERYKLVLNWLWRYGLLSREKTRIDTPESFGDWFVLRKPHSIGLSVGYGKTEDAAIDAAMGDKR